MCLIFTRLQVPIVRRSQKLNDKITALQKLVSPYGKVPVTALEALTHIDDYSYSSSSL